MPYTEKEVQKPMKSHITELGYLINTPGDLTYVICKLMWDYWKKLGPSFTSWCLIRSAVLEAVADFRDRHISVLNPEGYEAMKLGQNGDIYD